MDRSNGGAACSIARAGWSWIIGEREEADRARAILLSLEGWTSDRIALAFCVQPDSVRHWRWIFGREGVAGLRARTAAGPDPVKACPGEGRGREPPCR